jgi:hypothetical protein
MPSIMTLQGPRLAEFTCLNGDCGTLQGAYVDTLKRHWLLIGVSLVAGAYLTVGLPTIKQRLGLRGPSRRRR